MARSTGSRRNGCRQPASFSASRTSSRRTRASSRSRASAFEVAEGEVHALVGENGAGKSTLMAVAAGSTLPDQGIVEIGGRADGRSPRRPPHRRSAWRSSTSTSRSSRTSRSPRTWSSRCRAGAGRRSSRAGPGRARKLAVVGAEIDPVGARQRAEHRPIASCSRSPRRSRSSSKVLVLDEPTESLTQRRERRGSSSRSAPSRERGTAVVYISHRLPEVQAHRRPDHRAARRRDARHASRPRRLRGRDPAR